MTTSADLRHLALALAGTIEAPHFNRTAFKAKRIYVTLAPDGKTANFMFTPDRKSSGGRGSARPSWRTPFARRGLEPVEKGALNGRPSSQLSLGGGGTIQIALLSTPRESSTSTSTVSPGNGVAAGCVLPSGDRKRCHAPCEMTAIIPAPSAKNLGGPSSQTISKVAMLSRIWMSTSPAR